MLLSNQQSPDPAAFYLAFQSIVKQAVKEALAEQAKPEPTPEPARPPATRKEAANFLAVSLPTIDALIATDQLKAYRIGKQVRINREELERFAKGGGE